ncbi:Staygreen protein [Cynara cardunculus var. scolymus]|uniref:Staygreen protein n=1 Tax=Cynara cardunculus var. scolymus TaxID=59895 RepID=A0A103XRC5_CYNCS|nr:Staygreen protein [Cynara cardunculus var. scolymus]
MASLILPTKQNPPSSSFLQRNHQNPLFFCKRRRILKKNQTLVPVARLFGPSIFEASKLKVLFLGVDEKKHPGNLPRTYTLTHSDITSKLTLAISQTINNSQGWYNKLYRDEVVAEWRKVKGNMSLHAFAHGDGNLLKNYPELQEASVWVYFHSNIQEFNKVECWGPLKDAVGPLSTSSESTIVEDESSNWEVPKPCPEECACCFPPMSSIPWSHDLVRNQDDDGVTPNGLQQKA